MLLCGRQRNHKLRGDLLIGETVGHELQDALFLVGKWLHKRRRTWRKGSTWSRRAQPLLLKRLKQAARVVGQIALIDRFERTVQESSHRLPFIQKQTLIALWMRQSQGLQQGGLGLGYRAISPVSHSLQDEHFQHNMGAFLGLRLRFPWGNLLERRLSLPLREGQTNHQERFFLLLDIRQLTLRSTSCELESVCPRAGPVFDGREIAHIELEPSPAGA